jgi:hypothetical protein
MDFLPLWSEQNIGLISTLPQRIKRAVCPLQEQENPNVVGLKFHIGSCC